MQKVILPCYLLSIFLLTTSLKNEGNDERYSNSGYFMAIVGSNLFELRDNNKYRADMRTKSASLNNQTTEFSRSTTALIFYGNNFTDSLGNSFDETVSIEYSLDNDELGEVNDLKIELNYDQHNYYHLPDKTIFKVTQVDWSADHKNCLVTADFDCRLRRWGFPANEQPIIRLKGKMVAINVTVPPWISAKLNSRAEAGQ